MNVENNNRQEVSVWIPAIIESFEFTSYDKTLMFPNMPNPVKLQIYANTKRKYSVILAVWSLFFGNTSSNLRQMLIFRTVLSYFNFTTTLYCLEERKKKLLLLMLAQ